MTIEVNPNYPSDLDSSIPTNDDYKAEGDDNIRNLKRVLKTTFPGISGAVTSTHTELNYTDGVTSNIQTQLNTLSSTSLATALPAQLGNAGKFISTDGTTASWTSLPNPVSTIQVYSTGFTGTFARAASKSGTYTQTGTTTVNATITAHGLAVGDRVYLDFTSGTGSDGWTTVVTTPTADTFTCVRTSLTTSGNVTMYPPIVITAAAHGLSTSGTVYVDFSGTYTDGSLTVFQATTNTFQVEPVSSTNLTGSGTVNLPSITKTYTYTKPASLVWAKVTVVGGGGQGGVGTSLSTAQPGCAGGVAIKVLAAASIGATETVTLGIAGCTTAASTSPSAGQNGGTSSFGASLSATGGLGGTNVSIAVPNTSTGVGGDLNLVGNNGNESGSTAGAHGANSQYGAGGVGFGDGVSGGDARGYGAGGAGAYTSASASIRGGLGVGGLVIVEEFY